MGITLHPFLDQMGNSTKTPSGYQRPDQIEFDDGTNFARYMPSIVGEKSLRGVVIPHAKPGGGSRAYDPHKPPHKRVHVDPHIEGQSVVVDLAQITPDIAEEATLLGQEYADKHADEVVGVDQIRLRSAAAFHLIGASQQANAAAQRAAPSPPPQLPATSQVISIPQPGATAPIPSAPPAAPALTSGPRVIKAASFNGAAVRPQPPAAPAQARGGLLDAYRKVQPPPQQAAMPVSSPAPVQAPGTKVTFGVPGFGLHEAYYHKVIIEEQQFVLVYDERYQGGSKFLPRIEGSFAARVEGDPMDYELVWPAQSFYDPDVGRTYFTLLIEKRVPQDTGEAQ